MRTFLPAVLVCVIACEGQTPAPDGPDAPTGDAEFVPVEPVDETDERQVGRDYRRMSVDQLAASVERVTGHRWQRVDSRGDITDRFEELAPTLGVPDYVEVVYDAREPSLLFQKFLDDAALDVCPLLVADDLSRADGERWLLPQTGPATTWSADADAIEVSLADALLRFHGRAVDRTSESFAEWVFLVRSLEQVSDSPTARWEAVCTALITHPDFYLY